MSLLHEFRYQDIEYLNEQPAQKKVEYHVDNSVRSDDDSVVELHISEESTRQLNEMPSQQFVYYHQLQSQDDKDFLINKNSDYDSSENMQKQSLHNSMITTREQLCKQIQMFIDDNHEPRCLALVKTGDFEGLQSFRLLMAGLKKSVKKLKSVLSNGDSCEQPTPTGVRFDLFYFCICKCTYL